MSNTIKEIQNILDESKDKVPDSVYLALCNSIQKAFIEEEEDESNIYECTYYMPEFVEEEPNTYNINYKRVTCILELEEELAHDVIQSISTNGSTAVRGDIASRISHTSPTYRLNSNCSRVYIDPSYIIIELKKF
jgi:hypothetical protein